MQRVKHWWQRIPGTVRKPLVLVIGSLFMIAAALTGWLPGPGGIPLFLIGVAILASEFAWAERLRDRFLVQLKQFGAWYRGHRVLGTALLIGLAGIAIAGSYLSIQRLL